MALQYSTVWEVRAGSGSDTNGGGFDPGVSSPGTDFSQQNSAQKAYTDLVAASGTTITSVARAFSSTDPGNFLQITGGSGWTAGIYLIQSVTSGTATVDRTIATGGSTGGTGNFGGALNSLTFAISTCVAGNTFYCKGTETITATINMAGGGQIVSSDYFPMKIVGYTTTRTDNGRYTITCATNSVNLLTSAGIGNINFYNIHFVHTASTRGHGTSFTAPTGQWRFKNCLWDGLNRGINSDYNVNWNLDLLLLDNCEIKNSISHAVYMAGNIMGVECYIHDSGGDGTNDTSGGPKGPQKWINTVFRSNVRGIYSSVNASENSSAINCAFDNNSSDGVKTEAGVDAFYSLNSFFTNNGGFGYNAVGKPYAYFGGNNFYYNNTSGALSSSVSALPGDVTGTATPYTNAAGNDFTINSTAGGGAAAKAAGRQINIPLP